VVRVDRTAFFERPKVVASIMIRTANITITPMANTMRRRRVPNKDFLGRRL
jgi:hypothetical protein